ARPATRTGDDRHARRGRFEEDDAEPLLFQAQPPGTAEHGEDLAASVEPGQLLVRHSPEEPHRISDGRARRSCSEPALVPPAARDRECETAMTLLLEAPDRFDEHVHALPRD